MKTTDGGRTQVRFRISNERLADIEDMARKNARSFNAEVEARLGLSLEMTPDRSVRPSQLLAISEKLEAQASGLEKQAASLRASAAEFRAIALDRSASYDQA